MENKPFRFGTVAAFAPDANAWAGIARRAEDLGYTTLLVPDTFKTLAPFPALAAAATATTSLRMGTFVLDVTLHHPAAVAGEAVSLDLLSGGRFELGLGTGRMSPEEREALKLPPSSPGERLDRLEETIRTAKATFASRTGQPGEPAPRGVPRPVQTPGPPILVAAFGPRALALAAQHADIVSFATPPETTEERLTAKADQVRDLAGDRIGDVELAMNLLAIGDEIPEWLAAASGLRSSAIPADTVTLLSGTPREMADTLLRRRDRTGISYVTVNSGFLDHLAPVIELLHDR